MFVAACSWFTCASLELLYSVHSLTRVYGYCVIMYCIINRSALTVPMFALCLLQRTWCFALAGVMAGYV